MVAYAARIVTENQQAIASEHPKFSLEEFLSWIEDHGETGYFVRDPESPAFDCRYFDEIVFYQIYLFEPTGHAELFRRIEKI